MRHLTSILDIDARELTELLGLAGELRTDRAARTMQLRGRTLAQIFEKPSLRTRLSFDVGMSELGGHCVYLSPQEVGLGRRESVADVARVVSRMVDAVVLRTNSHETIEEFARCSTIPVINGLSDLSHPCQALADILTISEKKGTDLHGVTIAYVGDGNNVLHSLMLVAALRGARMRVATPEGYEPHQRYIEASQRLAAEQRGSLDLLHDPVAAVTGADVVYTDVWTSMGQEQEYERRRRAFLGYQVNAQLLRHAKPDAIVMHDLPAHRGEEITDDVMDGPQSVVFDQAENRLHAQKAVLWWLLKDA
ncbi:MAG TPA: ornithine carbamoyltransferase [Candidatus Limnocylindria bacterium]|nr:ornithine carbamoyltransferase [Candidatus Limnocylindria bacterium]